MFPFSVFHGTILFGAQLIAGIGHDLATLDEQTEHGNSSLAPSRIRVSVLATHEVFILLF